MGHESFFGSPRTWIGIGFIIFYVLVGRRLWAAIAGMLDNRAIAVRAALDEAARLRAEGETLLREAQAQREQTIREAQAMIEQARAEAEQLVQHARENAELAAQRRERMVMDRIGAAEKAAIQDVHHAAADIATAASARVLAQHFGAEQDAPLIDRAIQSLPSALAGRRAA